MKYAEEIKILLNGVNPLNERKSVKERASSSDLIFAKRKPRIAIRESCLRGVSLIILYRKVDGTLKKYEVIPLSYRFRKLKQGIKKVLFAQDVRDKRQLKYFVLRNIYKAFLTKREVSANVRVEIV